jgi:hypothetical protein
VGEGMEYRMRVKANQQAMDSAQRRRHGCGCCRSSPGACPSLLHFS